MARAAGQGAARTLRLHGVARVAHIFVAQPIGDHHCHAGRQGAEGLGGLADVALPRQGLQHLVQRGSFEFQNALEVGFQMAVAREQIVQVTVQKPVLPNQLKQRVQKEPSVLHVLHIATGIEQLQNVVFVGVKQVADQQIFGREVVVQIAGADVQLG